MSTDWTDTLNRRSSSSSMTPSSSNAAILFLRLSYMIAGSTGASFFFFVFCGLALVPLTVGDVCKAVLLVLLLVLVLVLVGADEG